MRPCETPYGRELPCTTPFEDGLCLGAVAWGGAALAGNARPQEKMGAACPWVEKARSWWKRREMRKRTREEIGAH